MLRVLRFLALVFLALTVPVQGMAAVTAGQCMGLGHHQHSDGNDAHAHDATHDHAAHAHEAGEGLENDTEGKNAHCGPCAACCASASIAGAEAPSIVASRAIPSYTFSQFPPLGIQPDELDRPPLAL